MESARYSSSGLSAWRRFAAVTTLVAILLRAVVPVGWMPSTQLSVGVPIVICTGNGEKQIILDGNGRPIPAGEHQDSNDTQRPCAFVAVASLTPPTPTSVPAPISIETAVVEFSESAAAGRHVPRSPWQSRGPPRAVSTI